MPNSRKKNGMFYYENYIDNFSHDLEQTKDRLLNYYTDQQCFQQFDDAYIELLIDLEINKFLGIEQEFLVEKDKIVNDAIEYNQKEFLKNCDGNSTFVVDSTFECLPCETQS
jgi:hypothetical protein